MNKLKVFFVSLALISFSSPGLGAVSCGSFLELSALEKSYSLFFAQVRVAEELVRLVQNYIVVQGTKSEIPLERFEEVSEAKVLIGRADKLFNELMRSVDVLESLFLEIRSLKLKGNHLAHASLTDHVVRNDFSRLKREMQEALASTETVLPLRISNALRKAYEFFNVSGPGYYHGTRYWVNEVSWRIPSKYGSRPHIQHAFKAYDLLNALYFGIRGKWDGRGHYNPQTEILIGGRQRQTLETFLSHSVKMNYGSKIKITGDLKGLEILDTDAFLLRETLEGLIAKAAEAYRANNEGRTHSLTLVVSPGASIILPHRAGVVREQGTIRFEVSVPSPLDMIGELGMNLFLAPRKIEGVQGISPASYSVERFGLWKDIINSNLGGMKFEYLWKPEMNRMTFRLEVPIFERD